MGCQYSKIETEKEASEFKARRKVSLKGSNLADNFRKRKRKKNKARSSIIFDTDRSDLESLTKVSLPEAIDSSRDQKAIISRS
jgi:hypothetical protein